MTNNPAISVKNVSKTFWVHKRKDATVLSRVVDVCSPKRRYLHSRRINAVRDVSFEVQKGSVLGIVGKNAAGKTTLLRLIAGIHTPDTGRIAVRGSITSLINLSVGLQRRLSIHDNIFLACSLYGMQRSQICDVLPSIIAFGGLEECVDMYPYQLSSGMNQRLAFSIAIHTDPDVLLLDEVFSAGDIAFRRKAAQKMRELIKSDVTVVMTSHDIDRIGRLADRVLWMDQGIIRESGDPISVLDMYENTVRSPKHLPVHSR